MNIRGPEAGRTLGVEEEFLVVDRSSGRPVARSAELLAAADPTDGIVLHPELLATQVEAATAVCTTLEEIRSQVRRGRSTLAAAAKTQHAVVVAAGTPVLADETPEISQGERFGRIQRRYSGLIADYQSCGLHVHVGVPDRDTAVAVVNHVRPWLPTLLALSANSPFNAGQDSGYASWRVVQQARFPGSGVPPFFGSAREYDEALSRLVDVGVLVDDRMTFWLARPSPHLPTVELRAADVPITAEGAVLQAALSRALVRTALTELAVGHEASAVRTQVAAAAVWSAARYGLRGQGIDVVAERAIRADQLLERLITWVSPALEDTGDLSTVRALIDDVLQHGTGAERQRRAHAAGAQAVLRLLVAETATEQAGSLEF